MNRQANQLDDVLTIEGEIEVDEFDYFAAIQRQINRGCWSLQGSHGRTMMDAIKSGACVLGRQRARDYYGNVIPARTDVKAGTFGSTGFMREHRGAEWARAMARIK
jgi:hypothetical protein